MCLPSDRMFISAAPRRNSVESASSATEVRQSICRRLFSIVLEHPFSLRHPFAQALGLFRWIVVLGPIEFACRTCERLNLAGPLTPDRLIEIETVCDLAGRTSLQKNGKREAVLNRLTGALADVGDHGMCRIPHKRDAFGRPVWQRSAIVDAPAKGFV